MARSKRRVSYLAERASVPVDFALDLLRAVGLRVSRPLDLIPAPKMALAERALDLARPLKVPISLNSIPPVTGEVRATVRVEADVALTSEERREADIRIVGRRQPLTYMLFDELCLIHWQLVEDFRTSRDPIDPPGIKNENSLHSALTRCHTSLGRDLKYPTAPMAGAALLHSLIHNHPFHNGNKRSALVALLVFLDKNGWSLRVASDDELFDFVLSVGAHSLLVHPEIGRTAGGPDAEVFAIARWIHARIRPTGAPTKYIKFHQLRTILLNYGCLLEPRSGNRIRIRRGDLTTHVWYGGEGREVRLGMIPKIRRDLQLDTEHGYDSEVFYDAGERLPGFIMKYRRVLDRLAKT